jgi:isoquinoline 1-oxidoreductase subunit beta
LTTPDMAPFGLSNISRRDFVRGVGGVGGLLLCLNLPAQEEGTASVPGAKLTKGPPRTPSAFVQIAEDDTITIITPSVEMGQGGHTAMPMIILEELGGDWSRLKVDDAAAAAIYNNPMFGMQATVGSFSVRGWYTELRRIGAAAREMLVQAAAKQWAVPPSQCTVARSLITHTASGRTHTFGSVAKLAAALPVPADPPLKAGAFEVIGTSPQRVDITAKVDGSAQYGIDMRLPNMLYAALKCCPTLSGKLKSFDDSAARKMAGFHSTVALPTGVIATANSYWRAKKALDAIQVEYDLGKLAGIDSDRVSQILRSGFDEPGVVVRNDGDARRVLASAKHLIEAVYEAPYLAHACMEPMNCTAVTTAGGGEIWCGTQQPQAAQAAAAAVLGVAPDRVKVNVMYLGGGFGRRGEADYVAQAMSAAKATGRPVKLIWSREEDIRHDFYRPAAAIRFRGALDNRGQLIALECNVVTASAPRLGPAGDAFAAGGVSDANYAIPNFRVTCLNKDIGVRFGFWRSVNESHNPFMLEGFIDELARQAKVDPYQMRASMLQHPKGRRQLGVLDLVAQKSNWGHAPAGHHLGISAFEAFGSLIGTVVEISVKDRALTLHRVVTGIDCGVVIHPNNLQAQLEGGMAYGLAAVLRGEITLKNGAVQQSNFHDYPMLAMAEMPRTESYVVASSAAPGGVGEPGTGPIAPAMGNAIYAATGERLRSLPLSRHNFTYAAERA